MARITLQDFLQDCHFWLVDVGGLDPGGVPVFLSGYGFKSITAPSIEVEMHEIVEGNWPFKRKVIKGADVGPLTLQRGVAFEDSDFWRWTMAGLLGDTAGWGAKGGTKIGGPTPRRNLLLLHFFARNPFNDPLAAQLVAFGAGIPGFQAPKYPARAFVLYDCLPGRYKTGSDFDASGGEISIKELEIHPELIEEISLLA